MSILFINKVMLTVAWGREKKHKHERTQNKRLKLFLTTALKVIFFLWNVVLYIRKSKIKFESYYFHHF